MGARTERALLRREGGRTDITIRNCWHKPLQWLCGCAVTAELIDKNPYTVFRPKVGLTKPLTTHVARHTFATTVALANGVPIESLSRMLGHKDIHTTQIYAKVLAQTVVDDGAKLAGKIR